MKQLPNAQRRTLTAAAKAPKAKEPKAKTGEPAKKEKQKKPVVKSASIGKAKKTAAVESQEPVEAIASEEEAAPKADKKADRPVKGRQLLIDMLSREEGITSQQMVDATGWQKGAISGTMSKIKKLLVPSDQVIVSSKDATGALVYKIAARREEQPVAKSA